jgi:predicted transglutaminase-like cysteine proteinase
MPPTEEVGRGVVPIKIKNFAAAAMVAIVAFGAGNSQAAFFSVPEEIDFAFKQLKVGMQSLPDTYDFNCAADVSKCNIPTYGLTTDEKTCDFGGMPCPSPQATKTPLAPDCELHFASCNSKKVSLFSLPKTLKPQLNQIEVDQPTLGPMAHMTFCIKYPSDCEVRKIAFRGGKYKMTDSRWQELTEINRRVNRFIRPERNMLGLAGEKWLISPEAGDCNDYAVTKRHELLERGWPSRALLLAEVVVGSGEHHLVLVVRTDRGDFLLDNLSANVRPWSKPRYEWVRMQSPRDPKFWSFVRTTTA